jgi:hypothetical protein
MKKVSMLSTGYQPMQETIVTRTKHKTILAEGLHSNGSYRNTTRLENMKVDDTINNYIIRSSVHL